MGLSLANEFNACLLNTNLNKYRMQTLSKNLDQIHCCIYNYAVKEYIIISLR